MGTAIGVVGVGFGVALLVDFGAGDFRVDGVDAPSPRSLLATLSLRIGIFCSAFLLRLTFVDLLLSEGGVCLTNGVVETPPVMSASTELMN